VSITFDAGRALPLDPGEVEAVDFALGSELSKLGAFLRRDFLIAWSYRMAFVTDASGLFLQAVTFWFVGKLINPRVLPTYGGTHAGYMEFVAAGILLGAFVEVGMRQVGSSIRQEQLMGTLESVLLTPTAIWTIQTGSALYAMVYVPIRTLFFFIMIALVFGVHFSAAGILPALAILLLFLPFVWGLGILSAAAMLTYRRGGMGINFFTSVALLGSGAFFPLALLPHWIQTISTANPIARAINGLREALIGGTWTGLPSDMLIVGVASVIAFGLGTVAFKLALAREQRRGTLGIY
jgi:ABC-2 type transport system permease protein